MKIFHMVTAMIIGPSLPIEDGGLRLEVAGYRTQVAGYRKVEEKSKIENTRWIMEHERWGL
jgi:hypothetical protein